MIKRKMLSVLASRGRTENGNETRAEGRFLILMVGEESGSWPLKNCPGAGQGSYFGSSQLNLARNVGKVLFYQAHHIRECRKGFGPLQTAYGYAGYDISALMKVGGSSHDLKQLTPVSVAYYLHQSLLGPERFYLQSISLVEYVDTAKRKRLRRQLMVGAQATSGSLGFDSKQRVGILPYGSNSFRPELV